MVEMVDDNRNCRVLHEENTLNVRKICTVDNIRD